jgi:ABC-type transporter Mla MlaB component
LVAVGRGSGPSRPVGRAVSSASSNGLFAVQLHPPSRSVVVVDASAFTDADAAVLETLVRLQLTAHRLGASILLRNAPRELIDLLALFGLSEVLPVDEDSVVESDRQIEEREQAGIDEEVDPGDAAR